MTVRTKIWLIAVSVALTVFLSSAVRLYLTQARIIKDAQTSAEELAHDIAEDLKSVEPEADDREYEEKLLGYLNRHSRIVRLDLYVYREAYTPSSRIAAPRGDRPEITRFAPLARPPLGFTKASVGDAQSEPIELAVDLKGPWKATLVMKWTLGPVESALQTERRVSLVTGVVLLVALTLLSGLITNRVIGRPLEVLAGAMRAVEGGDLSRRIPVATVDEFGRLSQGFNRMLERLSRADAQIRAFNQRLAAEIEAATRDLSEKNATLNQLNRLLADMRRDNASKVQLATLGQLAAQLAHEIGTPLSSVSGHLQLALLQRDLQPALRDRLEVGSREIERISRIVRDYLDSTRPLEPERKATDLPRLLDEAIELTRAVNRQGARRAPVVRELGTDSEALRGLITDPGLLRQILINLLTNALDAVGQGLGQGQGQGTDGRVTITARTEADDVLITVSDTGHGIAADDLNRIFEPFYTTKGRGKGTGLGLAICRQLTAALGGTIAVESTPNRGSTFFVRLPWSGPPAKAVTEPALRAVGAGGRA
ncbi:MAG TPA: ATP-binding protein [Polyangia bacterium]|jgi:signal transduction histidine kinase